MKVVIGTVNPAKVGAVKTVLAGYSFLMPLELEARSVPSGVPEQPVGLEQIQAGAVNRAKAAFSAAPCALAIGIESGILWLEEEAVDIALCAIYDGQRINFGTTPGFVVPPKVAALVRQGQDLSEACRTAGLTSHQKIGEGTGLVGILTEGRLTREDTIRQAIHMALTAFEKANLYQ